MNQPDPMLSMLEWLCDQMMEAEVSIQLSADKSERTNSRAGYRSRLSSKASGYQAGNDVPYGSQGPPGRIYSVLRERL